MKSKTDLGKKITIGTIASSLLISSCTEYNIDSNSIYGNLADNNAYGKPLCNINEVNLNENFVKHLNDVRSIIIDVTSSKKSLELFCSNISEYLKYRNMNLTIKLSNEEISLIKALTDKDIKQALQSNNLQEFIKICKNKNYLNLNKFKTSKDIGKYFKNENDITKLKKVIIERNGMLKYDDTEMDCFFAAVAIALAYVAVVLYVVAAVDVAVEAGAIYHQAAVTRVQVKTRGVIENYEVSNLISKEPIVKIWLNEGNKLDYNILYTEFITKQSDEIIDFLQKNNYPINETEFRNIIITNLEAYYGIRK